MDAHDHLNLIQFARVSHSLQLFEDSILDVLALDEVIDRALKAVYLSVFQKLFFFKRDNSYQEVVVGVYIDVNLIDQRRIQILVFQFLRSYELTVLELLHFCHSVDNLNGAVLVQDSYVADFKPSIFIED